MSLAPKVLAGYVTSQMKSRGRKSLISCAMVLVFLSFTCFHEDKSIFNLELADKSTVLLSSNAYAVMATTSAIYAAYSSSRC